MLHPSLIIAISPRKGRSIFTNAAIPAHTIIEVSPVIVLSMEERKTVETTILNQYLFAWGENGQEAAIGLGYTSLYNHTSNGNCEYILNIDTLTITIVTREDINLGSELTIHHSANQSA